MSVIDYIENKAKDPIKFNMFLLGLIPVVFLLSYILSYYANKNLLLYIGIFICGLLSFLPLWILLGAFLLWTNPAKYKERATKLLGQRQAEQKRIYFLIMLSILWMKEKSDETVLLTVEKND